MRVHLLYLCCLLSLAWAGTAFAVPPASPNLRTTLLSIAGEPFEGMGERYINAAACADPEAAAVVRVENLGMLSNRKSNIAVWIGNGCQMNRSSTANTGSDCVYIYDEALTNEVELDISIPVGMLEGCDGNMTVTAAFLPMDTPQSDTEEIFDYGEMTFKVDTVPPAVPTNVKGGRGETQISVDWSGAGGDIDRYHVYYDDAIGTAPLDAGGAECATAELYPGAELDPSSPPSGVDKQSTNSNVTSIRLDGSKIDGDAAAVGVQAQDLAGNLSEVSDTACIQVVPTSGFWDLYKANGGTAESGCGCSAPGSRPGALGALPVLLGLLWLGLRRRRD